MTPDFALSFCEDGVRLLHRSGGEWTLVGETALNAPDLDETMGALRARAAELDIAPLRTKLLISNDQIRYLALDTTQTSDDDVRSALDEATSCELSDLVYDVVRGFGRTYIAAVARETLDEAEAFASRHGMGPVAYAAIPEPFTFVGEAFFGPTRAAADLLPGGDMPERDSTAAVLPGLKADTAAIASPPDVPAVDPVRRGRAAPKPRPQRPAETKTSTVQGGGTPQIGVVDRRPAADATGEEAALAADRLRRDAEASLQSGRRDVSPSVSADSGVPPLHGESLPTAVFRPSDDALPPHPAVALRARMAAFGSARAPKTGRDGPSAAAGHGRPKAAPEPRPRDASAESAPPITAARPIRTAVPDSKTVAARTADEERDRMTIFGARGAHPQNTGADRLRLAMLVAVLLAVLAGVGAMAAMNETGLLALFRGGPATQGDEIASAPDTQSTSPSVPAVSRERAVSDDSSSVQASVNSGLTPRTLAPNQSDRSPAPTTPLTTSPPGQILSPAEAQRIYAATGVWQRAPRLPLTPREEAVGALPSAAADPVDLPPASTLPEASTLRTDRVLPAPADPPPPGSDYVLDDRGMILATADGTLTPAGILVRTGRPALTPRLRPQSVNAALAADLRTPEANGVLSPPRRPTDLVAVASPSIAETAPAAQPAPAAGEPGAALPAAAFAGDWPALRPEGFAPRDAVSGPAAAPVAFEGVRPLLRPDDLAPNATSASGSGSAPRDAVDAALDEALAADPFENASSQAVALSVRPGERPEGFAQSVTQASPAAEPPTLAAVQQQAPVQQAAAPRTVQPSGNVPGGVAQAATDQDAINLRQINLIGVYGTESDRRALVRLSNGRYVKVSVGDTLDGGRVAAIGDAALNYVKRGRTYRIELPGA